MTAPCPPQPIPAMKRLIGLVGFTFVVVSVARTIATPPGGQSPARPAATMGVLSLHTTAEPVTEESAAEVVASVMEQTAAEVGTGLDIDLNAREVSAFVEQVPEVPALIEQAPEVDPAPVTEGADPYSYPPDEGFDLDCGDIGRKVRVDGPDPHRLDRDGDGWGCESS